MDADKVCKCGCGSEARYAYAPGHRPVIQCARCGKDFSPLSGQGGMCSQCRRHVRDGRPEAMNETLINSRKMQASAPEGKRWCSGCSKYRAVKFFGRNAERYYSRCKPCHRAQLHASSTARKYNLTADQYQAIKAKQGGKCAICLRATGASRALAVDHDHACCPSGGSCGQCVRGLLCSTCNKMLGFARDDAEMFERAAAYLRNPPARQVQLTSEDVGLIRQIWEDPDREIGAVEIGHIFGASEVVIVSALKGVG